MASKNWQFLSAATQKRKAQAAVNAAVHASELLCECEEHSIGDDLYRQAYAVARAHGVKTYTTPQGTGNFGELL